MLACGIAPAVLELDGDARPSTGVLIGIAPRLALVERESTDVTASAKDRVVRAVAVVHGFVVVDEALLLLLLGAVRRVHGRGSS